MDRMQRDHDNVWSQASEEVKTAYGKKYFDTHIERCKEAVGSVHNMSLEPVIAAFVDAITNENPKTRYLVDGICTWVDMHCVSMCAYKIAMCLQNEE